MGLPLGTVGRGRYTPINADSTKNPERLLALRGQKGATWFVNSGVAGGASGNGLSWGGAFLTLDEARAKALAGDLILVAEGHAETISAAIAFAVAGVHVKGDGVGDRRPVLTLSGASTQIDLDAAGILLENLVFKVGTDSQTIVIDVNSTDCAVRYCELREGSALQWVTGIDVNGGAANACDGTQIIGNAFYSITAGASNAIGLDAVADAVVIADNVIDGDFSDAGIHNPTGSVLTNLLLSGNIVRNRQTGDHAVELVSACTGEAVGNHLFADTPGLVFDSGSLFCSDCWEGYAVDEPAVPSPLGSNIAGEYWIHTSKATADVTSGAAIAIFTVSGGRVLVKAMIGEVTIILSGTTETLKYQCNPTTGTTTDLCGTLDVGGDEVGSLYSLPDAPGTALVRGLSGGVRVNGNNIVLPIGDVEAISSADLTGSIKHDIWWRPLDVGARLVAA